MKGAGSTRSARVTTATSSSRVEDLVDAIVRAAAEPAAARETFNVGATEFGTVRSDLQALIDHAGSSSRLQPVPVKPAEIALRGLELMRVSPLAEWHYKTAHKDSFVDVYEGAAAPGLAAATVEPRRADRDVRLVPREPWAGRRSRRHAPRSLEPAGTRPAQASLVIVLSQDEVRELLDLDELVDALAAAHVELSAGEASMPPRIAAFAQHDGLLGVMPAYLPSAGLACKLVTLFPRNRDRHTHQALICLFDEENGTPVALMDGTYITATRTAAGSALATRLLAREDARVLAILGAGVQAHAHAKALGRVREFTEIRVASRDRANAEQLAEEIGGKAVDSWEEALRGADVVAATTHSAEPIVLREWLSPGVHVNSVGANPSGSGEVDAATIAEASGGGRVQRVDARAASRRRAGVPGGRPWRRGRARRAGLGRATGTNLPGADHPV